MKLKVEDIERDSDVQPRAYMDGNVTDDYAQMMKEGVKFPPVVVFYDDKTYWLACGFHRVHAAEIADIEEIEADVRKGTKRDAMLYAVGTNATHGLRRTNADKRRAVETLLRDGEWSQWSDAIIAKACKVSRSLVTTIIGQKTNDPRPDKVKYRDRWGNEGERDVSKNRKPKPPIVLPGVEAKRRAYEEALAEEDLEGTVREKERYLASSLDRLALDANRPLYDDASDIRPILRAFERELSALVKSLADKHGLGLVYGVANHGDFGRVVVVNIKAGRE